MKIKKLFTATCFVMLISAAVIFASACSDDADKKDASKTEAPSDTDDVSETKAPEGEAKILGEGDTVFTISVVDKDKNEEYFEIHTDKTIVGDALSELGFIEGDEGEYGLFVKKVNGITADYDTDGVYWAFYVDGEYAITGVDSTEIAEGSTYSFKVE